MTVFRSQYSDYLAWIFNSPLFDHQAGAFMTSTINQLTIGVLNEMEIPIPPLVERQRICEFVGTQIANLDGLTAEAQHDTSGSPAVAHVEMTQVVSLDDGGWLLVAFRNGKFGVLVPH
jgi:hypothetical protein